VEGLTGGRIYPRLLARIEAGEKTVGDLPTVSFLALAEAYELTPNDLLPDATDATLKRPTVLTAPYYPTLTAVYADPQPASSVDVPAAFRALARPGLTVAHVGPETLVTACARERIITGAVVGMFNEPSEQGDLLVGWYGGLSRPVAWVHDNLDDALRVGSLDGTLSPAVVPRPALRERLRVSHVIRVP
jgi:hypothetical protein